MCRDVGRYHTWSSVPSVMHERRINAASENPIASDGAIGPVENVLTAAYMNWNVMQ